MNSVVIYDVMTNSWSDGPTLPIHVSSHQMLVINEKVVLIGGWSLERGWEEDRLFELGTVKFEQRGLFHLQIEHSDIPCI